MDVKNFDAEEFLELIYGETEGWVDLPAKVSGQLGDCWVPFHAEWPNDGAISRRIDSSLRDREDLYYSVAKFAKRGRRIEDVLPAQWLWADLDEVHPTTASKLGLHPTLAIESSPGRYQALWRLTRRVTPKVLEKLNRSLTYALEADRGGWDLTQVLRIPGTRNYKYPSSPMVRLLWHAEDVAYDPKLVWKTLKSIVPVEELQRAVSISFPRTPIPRAAKTLLRTPADQVVEGERSNTLWRLECLLAESGLDETEILSLVWDCAWNKWRGVATGRERLKREVHKAVLHVSRKAALKSTKIEADEEEETVQETKQAVQAADAAPPSEEGMVLPWVGYSSFLAMQMEKPKWMVEGIWTAGSHGLIAGEPKTSKTTTSLALALSVASGRPFLGEYAVHTQGPVLVVQEENAPWMIQDRLRKLAAFYGLLSKKEVHVQKAPKGSLGKITVDLDFPVDVPLALLNNYGFDLTIEEHRDLLVAKVEDLQPALIVLDPLGWMIGDADENKAVEIRPVLKWLMRLRYEANCAIAVIHHFGKLPVGSGGGPPRRAGQRVLGSAMFHGWADTAIYAHALDSGREKWTRTRLELEFRSMAPRRPIEIDYSLGEVGSLKMDAEIRSYSIEAVLMDMIRKEPGVTVRQLADRLGVDKRTVMTRLNGNPKVAMKRRGAGRGASIKVYPESESESGSGSGGSTEEE